jgi:hypothetical protein
MGLILSGAAGNVSVKAVHRWSKLPNTDRLILIINDILVWIKGKGGAMLFGNAPKPGD